MKVASAVIAMLLPCVASSAAAEKAGDGPAATLNRWAAAWPAGDVDKMLSFYESSKDVVAIASSGRRYDAAAGVRKMYEEAFGEADWKHVKLRDVKIVRDGDVAWATCRFEAELLVRTNDAAFVLRSQGSIVLRQAADGWKIAVEHFSPIANVPRIQRKE